MSKSVASGKSLLFDSSSLSALLSSKFDDPTPKARQSAATKEQLMLVQSIIKQETGSIGIKRNQAFATKKKKTTRKKIKSKQDVVEQRARGLKSLERARMLRLAYNNVHEFASLLSVPRIEVGYLDREYVQFKVIVEAYTARLIMSFEQLNGPEEKELTFEDAKILVDVCNIDIDHRTLFQLLSSRQNAPSASKSYEEKMEVVDEEVLVTSSLEPIQPPPPTANTISKRIVTKKGRKMSIKAIFFDSMVQSLEDDPGRAGFYLSFQIGDQIIQTDTTPYQATEAVSHLEFNDSVPIQFEFADEEVVSNIIRVMRVDEPSEGTKDLIPAVISLGEVSLDSFLQGANMDELMSRFKVKVPLTGAGEAIGEVVLSCLIETIQISNDSADDWIVDLASLPLAPTPAPTNLDGDRPGTGDTGVSSHRSEFFDDDPRDFFNFLQSFKGYFYQRLMTLSLGELQGMKSSYSVTGYQRNLQAGSNDATSAGMCVDNNSEYGNTVSNEPLIDDMDRTMSLSITNLRRPPSGQRPHSQPLPDSSSVLSGTSTMGMFSSTGLPPLQMRHASKSVYNRADFSKAGFDRSMQRPTPRVLKPGAGGGGSSSAEQIMALRSELHAATEGAKQLSKMVDTNIAWVQNNCDLSEFSSNFSTRTIQKCRNMATERITAVYDALYLKTVSWVVERWQTATKYIHLTAVAKRYAKIKAIELMTNTLYEGAMRVFLKGWKPWIAMVQIQKIAERTAAAIEIQRIIHGFTIRALMKRWRQDQKVTVLQCMARYWKARKVVKEKRQMKKVVNAVLLLQICMRNYLKRKTAKAEVHRRREVLHALKIQKTIRGKQGRRKFLKARIEKESAKEKIEIPIDTVIPNKPPKSPTKKANKVHPTKSRNLFANATNNAPNKQPKASPSPKKTIPASKPKKTKPKTYKLLNAVSKGDKVIIVNDYSDFTPGAQLTVGSGSTIETHIVVSSEQGAVVLESELATTHLADSVVVLVVPIPSPKSKSASPSRATTPSHSRATTPSHSRATTPSRRNQKDHKAVVKGSVGAKETKGKVQQVSIQEATKTEESLSVKMPESIKPDPIKIVTPIKSDPPSAEVSPAKATTPIPKVSPIPKHKAPKAPKMEAPIRPVSAGISEEPVVENTEGLEERVVAEERVGEDEVAVVAETKEVAESEGGRQEEGECEKEEEEEVEVIEDKDESDTEQEVVQHTPAPVPVPVPPAKVTTQPKTTPTPKPSATAKAPEPAPTPTPTSTVVKEPPVSTSGSKPGSKPGKPVTPNVVEEGANRGITEAGQVTVDKHDKEDKEDKKDKKDKQESFSINATTEEEAAPEEEGEADALQYKAQVDESVGVTNAISTFLSAAKPEEPIPVDPKQAAVAQIQRMFRRKIAQNRIIQRKQQLKRYHTMAGAYVLWSVRTIQRIGRGKIGRKRFKIFAEWRVQQRKEIEFRAATKMQSIIRAKRDKGYAIKLRKLKQEENFLRSFMKPTQRDIEMHNPLANKKDVDVDEKGSVDKNSSLPSTARTGGKLTARGDGSSTSRSALGGALGQSPLGEAIGEAMQEQMEGYGAEMDEKLKRLQEIEQSIKEREANMMATAKAAEERAVAMEKTLKDMEERAKRDEEDRLERQALLDMAAGPINSSRSAYQSTGPMNSARISARQGPMASIGGGGHRSVNATPRTPGRQPSARSARGGAGIPPDAPRLKYKGEEWVQLWDPDENHYYWYCELTQAAQWETPGQVHPQGQPPGAYSNGLTVLTEQGYESDSRPGSSYSIAATDYSTDGYSSDGGASYDSEFGGGGNPWQEYWDEQAQAKYWYNNATGEASWTKPDDQLLLDNGDDQSLASTSLGTSGRVVLAGQAQASEWVAYIDEGTGQEYWYNTATGETSWG